MRVLYIDIETAPNKGHVWGLWNQNIGLPQLMESGRVLCFAAKWRGAKRVMFWSEHKHGTEAMLNAAHSLLTEADVVVHYNGRKFDVPWLNGEFATKLGLMPPAPFQTIDLLDSVKRRFRFPSNKLAYVADVFKLSGKASNNGHETWDGCMNGNAKAWRVMERYNRQDVVVLEELHDKTLPWIINHPNMRLYSKPDGCPYCGEESLSKQGFRYTAVGQFQRYRCGSCGGWSSEGRSVYRTDIRGVA